MGAITRAAGVAALLAALVTPAAAEDLSSLSRGGRLYDNWYRELGEKPPAERHPGYPLGAYAADDAAQTWRCVACHGWDYRGVDGQSGRGEHYTGIKGIAGMAGAPPERVLEVLTGPAHGYGEVMDGADLLDLARFVSAGQTPLMARIDPASGVPAADGTGAAGLYQTVCATCHGADGQAIQSIPPLGDLARDDPWQTLHNVVNGHAAGAMPSLRALDDARILGTVAYMQGLPRREMLASVTRGGRLYGNWARETGRLPPAGPHPSWRAKVEDESAARGTWNCRECHGWDYLGRDGTSGRAKGIRGAAGADPAKIVAVLGDATHRYDGLLSRRDLLDLANFVSGGQIDMYGPIDRTTGLVAGAAERYAQHYQTMCATCHGADGRQVRTMPPLGRVVREQPWRALHSVLNGHPGETMPPLRAFPDDMVSGILAFAQRLPVRK